MRNVNSCSIALRFCVLGELNLLKRTVFRVEFASQKGILPFNEEGLQPGAVLS